jgi:hypothetical protein
MSEPVVRVLLVAGVTASALAVAFVPQWLGARRVQRVPLDLTDFDAAVLFFSAAGCRRCDDVRAALTRAGLVFEEVRHEDDPDRFAASGVPAVPLVVARDERGMEIGRLAGRVSRRRLRSLLGASGGR